MCFSDPNEEEESQCYIPLGHSGGELTNYDSTPESSWYKACPCAMCVARPRSPVPGSIWNSAVMLEEEDVSAIVATGRITDDNSGK